MECQRVGYELGKRVVFDALERTAAPPEALDGYNASQTLWPIASKGEIERGREEQGSPVRQRRRVPTPAKHEARAVTGVSYHYRILGIALREPVPRIEIQRVSRQHFAVALARLRPASLEHGLLGKQERPVRRPETLD